MKQTGPIEVYLPDTKDVLISPYGSGNTKLGFGVFTYSRLPGNPSLRTYEGFTGAEVMLDGAFHQTNPGGTCPGSTKECEAICFAKRIGGIVQRSVYAPNSLTSDVPPIPAACRVLRIHVSGDFNTVEYIDNWITRLTERPDVEAWTYTRSWRVQGLLPALERLRALPNLQLFASMDASCEDLPPAGWRRSWIWRDWDGKDAPWPIERRLKLPKCSRCGDTGEYEDDGPKACMPCVVGDIRMQDAKNMTAMDGTPSFVCPEDTGDKKNCAECGYCFLGNKNDVVFLEH